MWKLSLLKIFVAGACASFLALILYLLRIKNFVNKGRTERISREITFAIILFCLIICIPSGFLVYALYVEPNWIQVDTVTIKSPRLAEILNGVKMIHISDLHITHYGFKERKLVKTINSLKPDIIFFTGELIGESDHIKKRFKVALDVLADLEAPLGIWAAPDIMDELFLNNKNLAQQLIKENIKFLTNNNAKIFVKPGRYFRLVGVGDASENHAALNMAMFGIYLKEPKVLLSHSPEIVDDALEYGIDLILAGHTQGGQTGIAWIRNKIKYLQQYEKYMSGLHKFKNTYLYVNRGIETKNGTGRFLCRPEITVLNITK